MKKLFAIPFILLSINIFAQNYALILDGTAHINIDNGAILVVDQPHTSGIHTTGNGVINSEAENNRVAWVINANTGDYIIPFGISSAERFPMTYGITAGGSVSGALTASTWRTTDYQNTPRPTGVNNTGAQWIAGFYEERNMYCVDRFWVLTDAGRVWGTKPTSTLTFQYADWEDNVNGGNVAALNNSPDLGAQYWDNEWTPGWFTGVAPLGSVSGVRTVSGVNAADFNAAANGNLFPWVLVLKDFPLPIELLYFAVNCTEEGASVEWASASEINNDYYTIQRSENGDYWQTIAQISGAGNSNQSLYYSYMDTEGKGKDFLYRLLQTDYNGSMSLLGVKDANCDPHGSGNITALDMNLYADFDNTIYVTYYSASDQTDVITLFDMNGKLIGNWEFAATQGVNHFRIPVQPVSHAIYLVTLHQQFQSTSKKILLR